jgi:hypothetical protein
VVGFGHRKALVGRAPIRSGWERLQMLLETVPSAKSIVISAIQPIHFLPKVKRARCKLPHVR